RSVTLAGAVLLSVICFGCMIVLGYLVLTTSNLVGGTRYFLLHDDAMISMRYARNLVAGAGLVWNPGDRVQGFTNLAWTLAMAGGHALLAKDNLVSVVFQLLGVLLHSFTTLLLALAVRRRHGDAWALIVAAAYGFAPTATTWALS